MSYLVTFLEGVITFISPCLLPMLPIYLSYFAAGTQGPGSTRATAKNALGFILGFTVTFLLLGTLAGSVGMLLYRWQFAVNLMCGVVVVLSPACAAFDRFKNFMERGRVFKQLVQEL